MLSPGSNPPTIAGYVTNVHFRYLILFIFYYIYIYIYLKIILFIFFPSNILTTTLLSLDIWWLNSSSISILAIMPYSRVTCCIVTFTSREIDLPEIKKIINNLKKNPDIMCNVGKTVHIAHHRLTSRYHAIFFLSWSKSDKIREIVKISISQRQVPLELFFQNVYHVYQPPSFSTTASRSLPFLLQSKLANVSTRELPSFPPTGFLSLENQGQGLSFLRRTWVLNCTVQSLHLISYIRHSRWIQRQHKAEYWEVARLLGDKLIGIYKQLLVVNFEFNPVIKRVMNSFLNSVINLSWNLSLTSSYNSVISPVMRLVLNPAINLGRIPVINSVINPVINSNINLVINYVIDPVICFVIKTVVNSHEVCYELCQEPCH